MVKTERPEPADIEKKVPIQGQPIPEQKDAVESAVEVAISKYGPGVALAVCILVLLSAGVAFWIQRNRDVSGENWSSIALAAQAQDAKTLTTTAEAARSSKAGAVAILNAGVVELNDAMEKMLKDKVKAKEEVKAAIDKLQQAKDSQFADDLVRQQATYSLAFAHESVGEFEKAAGLYQELVDMEENQFTILAKDGVARCNNPESKEFYDAFVKWEPANTGDAPADLSELLNGAGELQLAPPEVLGLEDDKDELPEVPKTEGSDGDKTDAGEAATESTGDGLNLEPPTEGAEAEKSETETTETEANSAGDGQ